jgi:hypothetical protein
MCFDQYDSQVNFGYHVAQNRWRKRTMSQIEDMKSLASDLASGLKKLGPNRTVALSVHVTKELIEELEAKAKELVNQLEEMNE